MGSETEELQEAFKRLVTIPEMVFTATVKAINKEDKTIQIEADEIAYHDVRLSANIDNNDKVVLYPAINSSVLVGLIGNDENTLYMLSASQVESVSGTIGACKFRIDTNGYHLTKDGLNVKDLLTQGFENQNQLNKEMQKVIVSVGVTPNQPKLQEIYTNNKQVINNLKTVFK
ncbi:conserved hypothetical protein [Tenacibaculum sp. 190524A02b]|uniref:Uncharacterized protein n=1 Tax=Tenacibaculum vairaonense TaxID=3137860 RepID=A0ABP1FFQ0_9FLAO